MGTPEKIIVITGATGGIGIEICKYLLLNNSILLAACRNYQKGEATRKEIENATGKQSDGRLFFFPADLCSFRSVDSFTAQIQEYLALKNSRIDILINNAGMIAPQFLLTPDGNESSLQVNYLSAKRLTETLVPYMALSGSKIINTLSCTVKIGKAIEQEKGIEQQQKEFISLKNYSNSKRMLLQYTLELKKRLNGISVYGVDPGIVNTGIITQHRWYDPLANIFFRPFIKTPAQGAIPMINAINYDTDASSQLLLFKGNTTVVIPNK
ncbi:MAG: SDR family NAD(P)-dependent oxidoreductase [Bacteroidales bacterium]